MVHTTSKVYNHSSPSPIFISRSAPFPQTDWTDAPIAVWIAAVETTQIPVEQFTFPTQPVDRPAIVDTHHLLPILNLTHLLTTNRGIYSCTNVGVLPCPTFTCVILNVHCVVAPVVPHR